MSDNIRRKIDNAGNLEDVIRTDIESDMGKLSSDLSNISETVEVPDFDVDLPNPEIDFEHDISHVDDGTRSVSTTGDTIRSKTPAESVQAQGYNGGNRGTSYSVGGDNSTGVPHDNLATPGSIGDNTGLERPGDHDGLGEPGSSEDEMGNGYSPRRRDNNRRSQEQGESEQDKGKKGQQTGETGGQGQPDEGSEGGIKKPNQLEEEKARQEAADEAAKHLARNADNPDGVSGDDNKKGQQGEENPKNGESEEEKKKKEEEEQRKKEEEEKRRTGEDEEPGGNGYGALKKQRQNPNDPNDATSRARRNLEHQNRVNNGSDDPKKKTSGSTTKKSSSDSTESTGNPFRNALNKLGNGLKDKVKGLGKKDDDTPKKGPAEKAMDKAKGKLKNAMLLFMKTHPVASAIIILAILILFFFFVGVIANDPSGNKGRGKKSCTYELNGVLTSGTVTLENLKVELINCDGKADNYEVLATVDFEKYILGVALAEAGASAPDEALKAQMIAVRNFSLTRNQGMCPNRQDSCFHGYNPSTGVIRMRACTNDQVYWDYTKDCPKIDRPGQPTLYCEGVDGATEIWKRALSEQRKQEVEALAAEVMGEVLLDENGNVLKLGYMAEQTDQFIAGANAGKSYVEILEQVYGSSSYSSAKCSYGGVFDYGDYELTSDGDAILHEPLEDFLKSNGSSLEEFSELIADNVDDAGWGTRAGVVAAAVTLIAELGNNYDVKVPYYWGGGHYDGVVDGALGYWGSTQCHTYANNQHYNYCGFDCSGFVPWAIKNGGFKKGVDLAGNFLNMPNARKVTLSNSPELQPGDLLESTEHIVLVVGIDEASGQYICAEASGNQQGVLFTRRPFNQSGYWGVDLEDYYNNPNNIREPIR